MKKLVSLFLALLLCCGIAQAEDSGILGKPFPDFTVTDVDGNTFTLSEALKHYEAAVINIWATWCGPCRMEFPFLNEAYAKYGDRVAFISLSSEENDTNEVIAAFRAENGLSIPMGRDEGGVLADYINGSASVPATVVVDRFGNAVFFHGKCFKSAREVTGVLDAVLGEGYTETTVLADIPEPDATAAFPASASRDIIVVNENAREMRIVTEDPSYTMKAYVVEDEIARLRAEIMASDDPYSMVVYDAIAPRFYEVSTLLDAEQGCYALDLPMPGEEDEMPLVYLCLYDFQAPYESEIVEVILVREEGLLDEVCELFGAAGWEPADGKAAQDAPQAYVVRVVDQYGDPVPGVFVNFCTDTTCTVARGDDTGAIVFEGEPQVYHVQMLKAPQGYSFDAGFDFYTGSGYGEWVLRVRKDG